MNLVGCYEFRKVYVTRDVFFVFAGDAARGKSYEGRKSGGAESSERKAKR